MKHSNALRKTIVQVIHSAGASHVGSSLSVAEMLDSIYGSIDLEAIRQGSEDRDRVVLSKGHAAAALYSTLYRHGLMDRQTLDSYYTNGSELGGHAAHAIDGVEHSTGALGHGLSVAVGMALGLRAKKRTGRVYVILGDGEMHEGSNWEALMLAGHHRPDNLCVMVDNNGLGGIGCTNDCCTLEPLEARFSSFGFRTVRLNGHDKEALHGTLESFRSGGGPMAIICDTVKGKGISFMEGNNVWHYRPPDKDACKMALEELEGDDA